MDVLTPRPNGQRAQTDFLKQLPAGQQLRAVALENARDGQVRVQLGSRTLMVNTALPLQRGESLQLQVVRGQAGVQFRVLERLSGQPLRLSNSAAGLRDGQQLVARLQAIQGSQWQLRTEKGQTLLTQGGGSERPGQHFLLQAVGSPARHLKLLQRLGPEGALLWVQGRNMQNWQTLSPGQQLSALALESVRPGIGGSPIKVMLGGNAITLQTQTPIERGQALTLELVQIQPRPLLRLQPQPMQQAPWQWLQARALPRHQPPANALAGLINTSLTAAPQASSTSSAGLLDALLRLIPGWTQLQRPQSLRNALLNSGVLLEARLAHAPQGAIAQVLAQDLRAQLLRLRSQQDSQSPLARLADSLLADIEAQQARSLQSRGQGEERLALSLLLRDEQEVHAIPLVLERDRASNGNEHDTVWRVRLQLDLDNLGKTDIIISYSKRSGIGVRFLNDEPAVRERFDAHLGVLQHRLQQRHLPIMGLSVTATESHSAKQAQPSSIDLRA
jgi:hypothetical protein